MRDFACWLWGSNFDSILSFEVPTTGIQTIRRKPVSFSYLSHFLLVSRDKWEFLILEHWPFIHVYLLRKQYRYVFDPKCIHSDSYHDVYLWSHNNSINESNITISVDLADHHEAQGTLLFQMFFFLESKTIAFRQSSVKKLPKKMP